MDDSMNDSDESANEEFAFTPFGLHDVVEDGNIAKLREMLQPNYHKKDSAECEEEKDEAGDVEEEEEESIFKSQLNVRDDMGCTPLHISVLHQRYDCFLYLLEQNVKLSMKCIGAPLLHLILRSYARCKLDEKINPCAKQSETAFQMVTAVIKSWTERNKRKKNHILEFLLEKDDLGNSLLHIAAMYNFKNIVQLLLEMGAHECGIMKNKQGNYPIHVAAKFGYFEIMQKILEYQVLNDMSVDEEMNDDQGSDQDRKNCAQSTMHINMQNDMGQTVGHVCAIFNQPQVLRHILESDKFDRSIKDKTHRTVEEYALRSNNPRLVELFNGSSDSHTKQAEFGEKTLFVSDKDCMGHLPAVRHIRNEMNNDLPPENNERLITLLDPSLGALRSSEFLNRNIKWSDEGVNRIADISDIIRVHDYSYVRRLQEATKDLKAREQQVEQRRSNGSKDQILYHLDPDTALTSGSFDACRKAAGAVIEAVDQVVNGKVRNAFCIVRPPGHHAGPTGRVMCPLDPQNKLQTSSHGFCLLNNVAIGAAYARHMYRRNEHRNSFEAIERVAIIDFDVHHGNGTEAILKVLDPSSSNQSVEFFTVNGKKVTIDIDSYRPWLNEKDAEEVFFTSVHGYGLKSECGATHETSQQPDSTPPATSYFYPGSGRSTDIEANQENRNIFNFGLKKLDNVGASRRQWKKTFRKEVFPRLLAFNPDLIFISAGFDGHKREMVNWGYLSLIEDDYEWVTKNLVRIANKCCDGRLISVLEGGYNFHGRAVSAFARSVSAHARALCNGSLECYDEVEMEFENNQISTIEQRLADNVSQVNTMTPRSKRRRETVDYVALAAQLDQDNHTIHGDAIHGDDNNVKKAKS